MRNELILLAACLVAFVACVIAAVRRDEVQCLGWLSIALIAFACSRVI